MTGREEAPAFGLSGDILVARDTSYIQSGAGEGDKQWGARRASHLPLRPACYINVAK
jgi:hypothetical protein